MKKRQIICLILTVCMLCSSFSALVFAADTKMPEPFFVKEFSDEEIGDVPDDWTISNVPETGNVSVDEVDREGVTEKVKVLKFEDTENSSGPAGSTAIATITGKKTVNVRWYAGHQGAIVFGSILKIDISSARNFRIVVGQTTYSTPAPALLLDSNGQWIDLTVTFNMKKKLADVYIDTAGVSTYKSTLGDATEITDGVLKISDVPLGGSIADSINVQNALGTGLTYIESIKVYEGIYAPVSGSSAESEETVKMPKKASWLSKSDIISAYENDGSESGGSASGRLKPLEIDKTPFQLSNEEITEKLNARKNQHPRYLVGSEAGWKEIYDKLQNDTRGQLIYSLLLEAADQLLEEAPYVRDNSGGGQDTGERALGTNLKILAGTYKITGDKKYFDNCIERVKVICELPYYGVKSTSLAAGHLLEGMGAFYDWCYDEIPDDLKAKMRTSMVRNGNLLYNAGTTNPVTWAHEYIANLNYIAVSGLLTAGLALYDDVDVRKWIDLGLDNSAIALATLGPEGITHEGIGYWAYGTEHFLESCGIMSDFFGIDVWGNSDWLKNTAYYRMQSFHPRSVWGSDWHDNSLFFSDAYGYDFGDDVSGMMYNLAGRYNDEAAQWMANYFVDNPQRRKQVFFSAVYYNPEIQDGTELEDLPPTQYFSDAGVVLSRSGWDDKANMVAFRCGHFAGKLAAQKILTVLPRHLDMGSGHVHPDRNHFYLIGNGELLIRDDYYADKATGSHNTLLVNGKGQLGVEKEGQSWHREEGEMADADISVKKFVETEEYDYWVGDATQSYSSELGLNRYQRHMIHLKELNALLILDDIKTDTEKPLELRLFPQNTAVTQINDSEFIMQTVKTTMSIRELTPEGVTSKYEDVKVSNASGSGLNTSRGAITVKTKDKKSWLNAMGISWSDSDETPPIIHCTQKNGAYIFSVNDKIVTLNPGAMIVNIRDNDGTDQNDASIASIIINGENLKSFKSDKYSYNYNPDKNAVMLRETLTVKAIPVQGGTKISYDIPSRKDGTVHIYTVSADGTDQKAYTINLKGSALNLARVKPVDVKANYVNDAVSLDDMLDEDYVSYWAGSGGGVYVEFDLGGEYELKGIDIAWYKGNIRTMDFDVFASSDGENFDTVYSGQSSGKTNSAEFYQFDEPVKARYIRVEGLGNSEGTTWFSISEFGAYIDNEIHVNVNGEALEFDTFPVMLNNSVMVPMRTIFEALGARVEWDGLSSTATGTLGENTVSAKIGSRSVTVNASVKTVENAPFLQDGRTMVPLRAISEGLGAQVNWDESAKTVYISK